ncbi:IS110 family transposase [Terrabacter carboxydivorans]|uniref:Transposase IS110-like N-terminal domain-containing protein n=1 Tax=Terrabacter carboxydivorans TaxID=619730 RepID=A0ABP5ZNX5_9MICO
MEGIIMGVDPHELSATIEVVDEYERRLGHGRFTTDKAGYAAMLTYAKAWSARTWAVEGANGVGRPLAQRLLEAGEDVVDVPAKLAARVRLFDTGHNRKTDAYDAHSIHIAAISQIRLDTDGRAYYRRKRAEGNPPLEAIRCLKRRISDAIYRQLVVDAAATDATAGEAIDASPGGHYGASQLSSAAGSNPFTSASDQPLPGPASTTLRRKHVTRKTHLDAPC